MSNPHEVLGVEKNATEKEIKQAHRKLARRWHPDRFSEGPEKLWAEQKMVDINLAYEEALKRITTAGQDINETTPEFELLEDARKLMELGQLTAARRALMRAATRCAEWNYLFGAVLLRLGECEKAVLYFGIAFRQKPDVGKYRTAYLSAEAIRDSRKSRSPFKRMFANARKA